MKLDVIGEERQCRRVERDRQLWCPVFANGLSMGLPGRAKENIAWTVRVSPATDMFFIIAREQQAERSAIVLVQR